MNKKEFKRGLEDYYFEKYKDVWGINRKKLEELTGINCRNLYVRIQNYQIDTYGGSRAYVNTQTYTDKVKKVKNVKQRVRARIEQNLKLDSKKIISRNEKVRNDEKE